MPELNQNHARAIGEKLQAARKKQQMSLRELARKAEISASMLSQIETGKAFPSVRSIYSIAAALAIPVDFFFPEQESNRSSSPEPELVAPGDLTASDMREMNINNQGSDINTAGFYPDEGSADAVVHAATRPTIELKGGVTWSRLTALTESGAEFLEITYAPGASSGAGMSHHEGREFGLILEGELVIELGFEAHILHPGDSIVFDSTTPHRLTNKASQSMRAIWVVLNRP
jgi:transcriptional regulator with XRE-family HTH domain